MNRAWVMVWIGGSKESSKSGLKEERKKSERMS